ncbi:N-acetyl-gamma-glutamyl-phosphate reductase [Candidatus Saganbacteria bacterium]|nr:N-acetyl-gamma-glutamyl-phosphate reductase [Candidatus Saganbacteria bacterium]
MIKVGIAGVGGYAGQTLLSMLLRHPEVGIKWIMSEEEHKGEKISDRYPHLKGICDLSSITYSDLDNVLKDVDLVFLSLPHGVSSTIVPKIIKTEKKIIDLGDDYRFSKEAVYGLPELFKDGIKKARLVGNPGCYPTASILALAPLIKNKLVDLNSIIVDAKSGISGAGRGAALKTLYCERNEGITAYNAANHRHMGEIGYQVGLLAGLPVNVTFVPHLTPMSRGILATCYGKMTKSQIPMTNNELINIYKTYYKESPFVRIYDSGEPNTKNVSGTNYCDIGVAINEETNTIIVLSVIDNLIKGAAGQAVQNMNIMHGLPEKTGLDAIAIYP